jgi:hypothetical protein
MKSIKNLRKTSRRKKIRKTNRKTNRKTKKVVGGVLLSNSQIEEEPKIRKEIEKKINELKNNIKYKTSNIDNIDLIVGLIMYVNIYNKSFLINKVFDNTLYTNTLYTFYTLYEKDLGFLYWATEKAIKENYNNNLTNLVVSVEQDFNTLKEAFQMKKAESAKLKENNSAADYSAAKYDNSDDDNKLPNDDNSDDPNTSLLKSDKKAEPSFFGSLFGKP